MVGGEPLIARRVLLTPPMATLEGVRSLGYPRQAILTGIMPQGRLHYPPPSLGRSESPPKGLLELPWPL
jgi:hypothetical protein